MQKRKLEELNLLDDFLFGSMISYPGIGESFVKLLLKTILGKDLGKLTVIPQKFYYGTDTDQHGARLDVYLEEVPTDGAEITTTVYDMEPDKTTDTTAIKALPRRVRFYHAKIDGNCLQSGESYTNLKNVFVILITPYDPFGRNRMLYTVRNTCEEDPSLPYDDGAKTIFLYTKGTEGNPPEELQQLLHYMEHTKEENAVNDSLKSLNKMIDVVKHDKEVSLNYMKAFERDQMLIKQGRELERINTERERLRAESAIKQAEFATKQAESATKRAELAERELELLKQQINSMKFSSENP